MKTWMLFACAALSVAVLAATAPACGGGSPGTPTAPSSVASTTFQGTIAGTGGQSGTLDITIQATVAAARPAFPAWLVATLHAQGTSTASGTLRVRGGSPATLTGTFSSAGNALSLSGGGFSVSGTLASGALSGTYTGAGSSGGFSALTTSSGSVSRYCGSYTTVVPLDRAGNPLNYRETGVWNIQIGAGGNATGLATSTDPPSSDRCALTGQLSGTTLSLSTCDGGRASGTVQGGSISGSAPSPSGNGTTTFSGSASACQ